jgi:two-component system, LuxR family, response regulator FixJ
MIRSGTLRDVPTVFVVDPDPVTGALIRELFEGSHLRCETFSACREFLAAYDLERPGCVVLEHRIPDMSGLQLQRRLAADGSMMPLVFVLAAANVSTAVELMRGGAVHVLEKPVRPVELLNAIQEALALDHDRRIAVQHEAKVREQIAALTRKEREVLNLIAQGKSTKAMATHLDLTVRAVEQRRRSLMGKLQLRSLLELMQFSVTARRLFHPAANSDQPWQDAHLEIPQPAALV